MSTTPTTAFPLSVEDLLQQISAAETSVLLVAAFSVAAGMVGVFYVFQLLFSNRKPKLLPLQEFQHVPLIRKEVLSHDTRRFTFGLPASHVLGLPTGQHVSLKFTDPVSGKPVQRSYTPVTDDGTVEEFSLVIKVYKPAPPKFPKGGLMSQHLDSLKIGDTILMKGPKGHMHWQGAGRFHVKPLGKPLEHRNCQQIGMMAGGTGITPMLQILHAIFRNPVNSSVSVKMIYANQTESDILVRQELEELQRDFPDRFQLWYTVDRNEEGAQWKYDTGFITKAMVEKHLTFENSSKATQFFMCGPPPMVKFACLPALKELGYTEKDWVIF